MSLLSVNFLGRGYVPQARRICWGWLSVSLLAAAILFGSWVFPPFSNVWEHLDRVVFEALDASLRGGDIWQWFWGLANHRGSDFLGMASFAGLFLYFAISSARSSFVHRMLMGGFAILYTVLCLWLVELLFAGLARHSPTLSVEGAFRLSEVVADLKFKDASGSSFPGDHGIGVIALATFMWFYAGARIGGLAVVVAIIFVAPRLVVGAHWASDILVGSAGVCLVTLSVAIATPVQAIVVDGLSVALQRLLERVFSSHQSDLVGRDDIERILVIRWSAMGGVVIATAAMQDLYEAFPGRTFHLNTMRPWDRLFEHDPRFSDVFTVDLRGQERGLRGILRWLRRVRTGRYDLIVDLQSSDHTRLLLAALQLTGRGSRYRLGHRYGFPYTHAPETLPKGGPAHEIARLTLAIGGVEATTERPVLHIDEKNRVRALELLSANAVSPGRYAVFLPGSQPAGHLKRWGAARYAALAERLHADGLEHIVLLGGPDEIDECAEIARGCRPWLVNLCGETELLDVAPLCAQAKVVVGNDTGTAHIASSATTPMVVVCGPTDPRRVKPMGDNVSTLQTDGLPCINCYCKAPCDHHSCMRMISPELVAARVRSVV